MNSNVQPNTTAPLLNPVDVLFPTSLTSEKVSEIGKEASHEHVVPVFSETINTPVVDHVESDADHEEHPESPVVHTDAVTDDESVSVTEQVDVVAPVDDNALQEEMIAQDVVVAEEAPAVEAAPEAPAETTEVTEDVVLVQSDDDAHQEEVVETVVETTPPLDLGQEIDKLWKLDHIDIGTMKINLEPVKHGIENVANALPFNQIWQMTTSMMHLHLNQHGDTDVSTEMPLANQLLTLAQNSMSMLNSSQFVERPAAQPVNSVM